MSHQQNIARIRAVYHALGNLGSEVVFVGGATVSLYADRPTGEVRPTDDVDIVVELANYGDYAALEERLRKKGFANDTASGVICRFRLDGLIVDVMPTKGEVLGFSNRWYPAGFQSAIVYEGNESLAIRIFTPVYFLASKLEAFNHRGAEDGRTSTDFEDIIFLLNNCSRLWEEIETAPEELRQYLVDEWNNLFQNDYLEEWISAHLDPQEQSRISYIMGGLRVFLQNKK
ncbi:MAG: hypothetical protein ACTHMM_09570 [Agriterribacter sp.]